MEDLGLSFSGRSAFVTGHTGFKGSWLSLWLCELGAKVVGFSLPPPTKPSNFEVSQVADRLAGHIVGDIRDKQALALAMREARPDLVIHMAAQPLVRESYAQPAETFETNVQGTVNGYGERTGNANLMTCIPNLQLKLGVRVSKRGDAIPVAGDLEGELSPVALGATGLKLEINRVHP